MTSSLLLWGGAVVLCSVASPILSFSHGASRTSCQEMIPGHIRAHPLDPRHSVVTIETSASSYLPGQLITVTVRSSRDFMGFLLQARSVGGERNGIEQGLGVRTERLGPLLVGGSWIRTPPGTHTLRCLFEGDTVTHSDKQLKRNLSFVWRAPDMPKGDIRFHITVVQSYFIYWTGVESRVVRDRSPSVWRGSRTKMVDGASTVFAVQKTATAQTVPKKQTDRGATLAPFLGRTSDIKSVTEILKFLKTQTIDDHKTLETNSSLTWTDHTVTVRKTLTSGSLPSNTHATPGVFAGVSSEITTKPFSFTTRDFPLRLSLPDTRYMVNTNFPLATFVPLDPLSPEKGLLTKNKDPQMISQERKLNNNPGRKDYMTLTLKTTQGPPMKTFYSPHTASAYPNSKDPSNKQPKQFETSSSPERLGDNIQTKSQMSIIKTEVTSSYQASSYESSRFRTPAFKADLKSQTSIGPRSTPKQTSSPPTTMPNILPALSVMKPTEGQPFPLQIEKIQSDMSTETFRPSSQTLSQTGRGFSQSFVTPQQVTVSTGVKDPKSQKDTNTIILPFVPSNTSSSSDSLNISFVIHLSENFTVHQSGGSVSVSKNPSVTSTSSIHSPSPPSEDKPKTTPAHSVPPSPSPISMPPHLTFTQQRHTAQPTIPTSSTISSVSASNHPSTSTLTALLSPLYSTSSRFSSASTRPPAFSSFYSNSLFYHSAPTLAPPSFSATLPSTASSTSFMSPNTSPYPEPTSAPHHFINTPFPSSVPHKITVGETLITQTRSIISKTHLTSPVHRKVVHPNPKPYPNLRPNRGQEIQPNIHNTDTKPKRPSDPSETPENEGKYPDIVPRHRAWELGMLLACSAGLGMALVVGVRYVYRQACGRRTEVTLKDREREYGRGEHGLIQLQECGDLVRVRKLRENSFVLLAEYDILPSATN
ncbi:uncharacterized protein reeld1 [Fundulus diaphanus]